MGQWDIAAIEAAQLFYCPLFYCTREICFDTCLSDYFDFTKAFDGRTDSYDVNKKVKNVVIFTL